MKKNLIYGPIYQMIILIKINYEKWILYDITENEIHMYTVLVKWCLYVNNVFVFLLKLFALYVLLFPKSISITLMYKLDCY